MIPRPSRKKNRVEQAFQIQARGFKLSGPGLQRELTAPLPPGQTKTLAVNLRSGVYHLEAPAQSGSAKRLSAELAVRNQ